MPPKSRQPQAPEPSVPSDAENKIKHGNIQYSCRHTYDSKNIEEAFLARVPKPDAGRVKDWSGVRQLFAGIGQDCVLCEAVTEVYMRIDEMFKKDKIQGIPHQVNPPKTFADLITGLNDASNTQATKEAITGMQNYFCEKLREEDFFPHWPQCEIRYWRGECGQIPVLSWGYALSEDEKKTLLKVFMDKELDHLAPFALEDGTSSNKTGWVNDGTLGEVDYVTKHSFEVGGRTANVTGSNRFSY